MPVTRLLHACCVPVTCACHKLATGLLCANHTLQAAKQASHHELAGLSNPTHLLYIRSDNECSGYSVQQVKRQFCSQFPNPSSGDVAFLPWQPVCVRTLTFHCGSATTHWYMALSCFGMAEPTSTVLNRIWGPQQSCQQSFRGEAEARGGSCAGRPADPSQASCLCPQCSRHCSVHRYSPCNDICSVVLQSFFAKCSVNTGACGGRL